MVLKKNLIYHVLAVGLAWLGLTISGSVGYSQASSATRWTMINVNSTDQQGDAHLIAFPDGSYDLIDTGNESSFIVPFLKEHGVRTLRKVIISHMHHDHYGALMDIIDAGIEVKQVYFNTPPEVICDREVPWGCNRKEINKITKYLSNKQIPLAEVRPGDIFYEGQDVKLEVLYAFDGVHTPVGETDVNDMSLVMLLTVGKFRALFTGDLNERIGRYLAENGKNLSADILKVPHHGATSLAPNEFFDKVKPKVALIPSPHIVWLKDRGKQARDYFSSHGIDTYVSGLHGHVTVTFEKAGYLITTEHHYE